MGKQIKKKLEGIKFKSFKKKEDNLPQCYLQAEIAHLVLNQKHANAPESKLAGLNDRRESPKGLNGTRLSRD